MRTSIAVLVLLALAGCTDPAGPPWNGDAPIRTDRSEYAVTRDAVGWHTRIIWTFTNPTDQTVSVVGCRRTTPPKLQKWDGLEWVDAWYPVVLLCLGEPVHVAASATYTDTLDFFAGFPGSKVYPQLEVDALAGTYRMVWFPLLNYDQDNVTGDPLPLEQRVSNAFEMRE